MYSAVQPVQIRRRMEIWCAWDQHCRG